MFDISFGQNLSQQNDQAMGKIIIGGFSETFKSDLSYWSQTEYFGHWIHEINKIIIGEVSCTGLITSLTDPGNANFLTWWPLYRLDDRYVAIQNHLLFLNEIESKMDLRNLNRFVPEYEKYSEEGEPVSEWMTSIRDLGEFLSNNQ